MPASLEVVKIAVQAYGSGDCEIAVALAGPHVRWDERASRTDGDLVWGHDNVQRAMRRYLDGWDEYRFDLEDLAEVGPGRVVGICRERGKPTDGVAVDRRFGGLWIVEGGKIVSWTTYLTPREAIRAAKELNGGRIEQPAVRRAPEPVQEAPKPIEAAAPEPTPEPENAQSRAHRPTQLRHSTSRPSSPPLPPSRPIPRSRPSLRPRSAHASGR